MTRSEPDPLHPVDGTSSAPRSVLDDPRALETLVRYDETPDEELADLTADANAARVLERLQAAEEHLREGLREGLDGAAETMEMIDPEDLYRFGGGPGAEPLDPERRAEVEAYLAEHPDEAGWVEALAAPVPAPLEIEPLTPSESRIRELRRIPGSDTAPVGPSARRVPTWLAWAPLAAAALVLAMALGGSQRARLGGLPESPVLRSTQAEALLFPRGRVLAPVEGVTTYAAQPLLEITPVAGATSYRFELRAFAEGAFEEGTVVWSGTSTAPRAMASQLGPNAFSWTAWAEVNGVERSLGSMAFVVVEPEQSDIMRSAAGVDSDARSTREDVRRLHAAGFLTDARFRARSLPPGEERDAYLSTGR